MSSLKGYFDEIDRIKGKIANQIAEGESDRDAIAVLNRITEAVNRTAELERRIGELETQLAENALDVYVLNHCIVPNMRHDPVDRQFKILDQWVYLQQDQKIARLFSDWLKQKGIAL